MASIHIYIYIYIYIHICIYRYIFCFTITIIILIINYICLLPPELAERVEYGNYVGGRQARLVRKCGPVRDRLHPIRVLRFLSFGTQPLENLSHYLWKPYDICFRPLSFIIWCSLPAAIIHYLMFASGRLLWKPRLASEHARGDFPRNTFLKKRLCHIICLSYHYPHIYIYIYIYIMYICICACVYIYIYI